MPLYDFACPGCGHEFEEVTEPGATASCPECGSPEATRLWRPIAAPPKVGLRGREAARSNDARRAREERKREQRG
jgi:putative FmdB family regulatory protein